MIPRRLYKYQPISTRSLENLVSQALYFGSPQNFNDPYDCALSAKVTDLTHEQLARIRKRLPLPAGVGPTDDEIIQLLQSTSQDTITKTIQNTLKNRGVCCFSEKKDNLLMWSHYASQGAGMCLEFDTSSPTFSLLQKVDYSPEFPVIDLERMLCNEDYDQITEMYCTKSQDWSYEQEWRLLHKEAGTRYHYANTELTGVYFGSRTTAEIRLVVGNLARMLNPAVDLWLGELSDSSFRLNFARIP